MAQVGSLVIDLIAETASFNANIQRASRQLNSEATRMNQSLASVNKSINSVITAGKALAGAAIVGELAGLAKRGLDYASSLGEISQQLGVTSDDLQIYRFAASQVGLSQDEMDTGLQKLTRSLGQAQLGGKQASSVFAALGVDIRTTSGGFKTAGDVLPEIAQALSKIPDPARRAAIETQLFGRAGQQLDTLLAGGRGAIDELRNAAYRLGYVLSSDQIQKADDTADKLAKVKGVLEARVAGVVADNAAAVYSLADAFEAVVAAGGRAVQAIADLNRGAALYMQENGRAALNAKLVGGWLGTNGIEDVRKYGRVARFRDALANDNGATAPKKPMSGGSNIDELLAGGGSGGRSRSARAIREVKTEAEKLNDALKEIREENNQILGTARLPYELGGPDDPLTKSLQNADFYKALREGASVSAKSIGSAEYIKELRKIGEENDMAMKTISDGWRQAAEDVLGSLQSLAYGIQNGNFLSIFGGVLELLMGLGSAGVFGSKVATGLNGAKGFASGGYTGSAGVDEIAGFVHGKEYVFDAKAVSRIGVDNLERLRKGYKNGGYVGAMPAAMSRMSPANRWSIDLRGAVMTQDLLQQMNAMATGAAMRGAAAGSEDAQRSMASRARRRLPGR